MTMTPAERMKGLETFVAVVEAGSFTAAADRLNLTKSAVGKAIARLESRLKKPLFERTTRRLTMTDAGEEFYKVCARVAAVERGLGIAQLATWLVEQQIRDGRLIKILPLLATQGLPLHLIWQRSREHAPKVQALISHLEATLSIRPMAAGVQ
jgi:DNA-binding transcriptional LysR family regulator